MSSMMNTDGEDIQLSSKQMKKLKSVEMEILKHFIDVCKKLKINYFVVQGTLLGAVRHKGFIPWDDDIDIGMLRKDYEIFLSKAQSLLPEEYFVQTYKTDPGYPHGFLKIRDSRTLFLETTCKNLKINHGIFIDVFPFDYYPENFFKKKIYELKKLVLRYRIRDSLYIPTDKEKNIMNIVRKILKTISKIIYPSLEIALEKQSQLYQSTKKSNYVINSGGPWGKKECIPIAWFEKYIYLEFEGISVNAPYCYDEYLTHVYGDYMTLPSVEKRVSHHFISAISFECECDNSNS